MTQVIWMPVARHSETNPLKVGCLPFVTRNLAGRRQQPSSLPKLVEENGRPEGNRFGNYVQPDESVYNLSSF